MVKGKKTEKQLRKSWENAAKPTAFYLFIGFQLQPCVVVQSEQLKYEHLSAHSVTFENCRPEKNTLLTYYFF